MTRARSLLRLVLAVALAASTQGFLFVQASFAVNQEWIAETLCVNRDRPEMDCDGKCVLMERMSHAGMDHAPGLDHDHGPAETPATLVVALSIRPLVPVPPRLAPPPVPDAADALGPLVASASGTPGGVFRPPRTV